MAASVSSTREGFVQLRLMNRLAAQFRKQLRDEFRRLRKAVIAGWKRDGFGGSEMAMDGHIDQLKAILDRQYKRIADVFGHRTLDQIKGAGSWERKEFADDLFSQFMRDWLSSEGTRMIASDIGAKTRRDIRRIIMDGLADGQGSDAIGRLLKKQLTPFREGIRANIIARTETHNAAMFASDAAAKASDAGVLMREWIDVDDQRTRFDHNVESGGGPKERIGMDDMFILTREDGSTYAMQRPGDPAGPASGVINCRCVLIYHPPDE